MPPPSRSHDEDDRPRRRRDDDEDERPRPRGRRRDADRPTKKGSALPIILGIVGGVIVLCGGGCAGVWFGVIKPGIDQAKLKLDEADAELKAAAEKAKQTGKERPPEQPPVATLTVTELVDSLRADRKRYDKKWITVTGPVTLVNTDSQPGKPDWGYVHLGVLRTGLVVCHFKSDEWAKLPKFDDAKTYSITGLFDANELGVSMDWCRVTGESGATLKADQLADAVDAHTGKGVTVSGVVKSVEDHDTTGGVVLVTSGGRREVLVSFRQGQWTKGKIAAGDAVTAKGTVFGKVGDNRVDVLGCDLVAHKPGTRPADKTPVATLTADELADRQPTHKDKWVTLRGKFRAAVQGDGGGVTLLVPTGKSLIVSPPIGTRFGWKEPPQPLDELEFTGKVSGNDRSVMLTEAVLVKQSPPSEMPVKVTADDLTAEFAKDTEAATKKYTGKVLQVSGKASSTASAGNRVSVRGLQDTTKKQGYFVECMFEGDARDAAKGVKLQEQVAFVGLFNGIKKGTGETYTVTLIVGRVVK